MMLRTLSAALALTAVTALMAASEKPSLPVAVAGADWHARGEKWFKSADEESRKAQMKEASRALKRPCKYCHTEDFEGFTDKKEIAQQMMALSAENDVTCEDCHDGRDKFTKMGEEAHHMWDLAHEKKVFCDDCHEPRTKFEKLTANGKKFHDEWEAREKARKAGGPVAAPAGSIPPSAAPSASPSRP